MSPSKRIVYSRYYTIFIVCAFAVSTAYVIYKLVNETGNQHPPQTMQTEQSTATPNGIGTKADPIARIRYETMRLVDPATGKVPANIRSKELEFAKSLPKKSEGTRGSNWTHRGPGNEPGA